MTIQELLEKADTVIEDETLRRMFKRCFLSTLETSVHRDGDKTYIITGDINAMWLRDSSCQVNPYLPYMREDSDLQAMIKGVIKAQGEYILIDPYANAFLNTVDTKRDFYDTTIMKPYVWERKFELDSLSYPIKLAYRYYKETQDRSIFNDQFLHVIHTILQTLECEQYHDQQSTYTFEREQAKKWNLRKTETLQNKGRGFETRYTGMVWSGFRPSDDACALHFNIPGNMLCSKALEYLQEIVKDVYQDTYLLERITDLKFQIDYGISLFGIYDHPQFGKIYAYETDGYGNHILMDDANVPSLLSIPYLGYSQMDAQIYKNTRDFILSKNNPYYYEGTKAKGIGSPHTPNQYIWHIALTMQGLTANNCHQKENLVQTIMNTTGNTGYCHESFYVNDDTKFTRPWFCWANSLFAELVIDTYLK